MANQIYNWIRSAELSLASYRLQRHGIVFVGGLFTAGCLSPNPPVSYEMVKIQSGHFKMGAEREELDEKPVHRVDLTQSFAMGRTEVTQALWLEVMGENPSSSPACGGECPVDMVNWFDAVSFANALSKREGLEACYRIEGKSVSWPDGLKCHGYRLPTEAEWEYAAKNQGQAVTYPWGDQAASCSHAVMNQSGMGCGAQGQKPVCSIPSGNTQQGICDMSGNLYEWVWDWYGEYPLEGIVDPLGPAEGFGRGVRGGGWFNSVRGLRASDRSDLHPMRRNGGTGLRLAKTGRE
jgi:formylglycine-generating enzyme required for sulfatase activity